MIAKLSDRYREIFEIIVADYISTADPVGSRTIAKKHPGHISAATIRNVMADLTEMGLIVSPHISAGRMPTAAGFRYYVDSLFKKRELTDTEMEAIREKCMGEEHSVETMLQRTSKILAAVSHYVGLVVMPSPERVKFKRIEFVPLSSHRILGIFVSQEGIVENRLIEVGEEFTYPELEKISNYCNSMFAGLSIEESMSKVEKELEHTRADYDELLKKAMLFSKQIFEEAMDKDIVVDGEMQLLNEPEFAESEEFKTLMNALEEKQMVLKMLERVKESEGVKIFIGSEAKTEGMDGLSLVGAPYFKDGKVVGTLGVIGPMRMDYSRVVPIVDFTAKVLGDALET